MTDKQKEKIELIKGYAHQAKYRAQTAHITATDSAASDNLQQIFQLCEQIENLTKNIKEQ